MSPQDDMHCKVEFDLDHFYAPSEEHIFNIICATQIFEIIEDGSKISLVVVPKVSFSQARKAMTTLSTFLEQQQSNVNKLRSKFYY